MLYLLSKTSFWQNKEFHYGQSESGKGGVSSPTKTPFPSPTPDDPQKSRCDIRSHTGISY